MNMNRKRTLKRAVATTILALMYSGIVYVGLRPLKVLELLVYLAAAAAILCLVALAIKWMVDP